MTPSEELELEEIEKFRDFKREQKQKLKTYKEKAKERKSNYLKRTYGLGNWRKNKTIKIEDPKKAFREENQKLIKQLSDEKKKKTEFENHSIIDILHKTR